MTNRIEVDLRYVKSYATVANLDKALAKAGLDEDRHLLVRCGERGDRFTAVFPISALRVKHSPAIIAALGFMVIG